MPERSTAASVPRQPANPLGAYGERPPSPFAGLPVSEVAIFAGAIGLIVGLIQNGGAALIVGVVVCALGVIEITAREHFSGYRSHTTLLAAAPAVGAEVGFVAILGAPHQRLLLLVVVIPVYAVVFVLLRKRFRIARQARIARAPKPG
jgi:type IV secretory pathway VirB3-like protein